MGISYCNGDQQARALDLAHVRYSDVLVGLESAHDLPARADDAYISVNTSQEQAVGSATDARYFVPLEKGAGFVVVGKLDLADIEEVERFPLLDLWCQFAEHRNDGAQSEKVFTERAMFAICLWLPP